MGILKRVSIALLSEIVAKFDTGNACSAIQQFMQMNIKLMVKSITWKYHGKAGTSKITEILAKVDVGGLNDYSEKRYGVLLQI